MEADANMTLRNSASASGRPLVGSGPFPVTEARQVEIPGADVQATAAVVGPPTRCRNRSSTWRARMRLARAGVGDRLAGQQLLQIARMTKMSRERVVV